MNLRSGWSNFPLGWWSFFIWLHSKRFRHFWFNVFYGLKSIYHILSMLPWWRHQIETFSALLALCEGNHRWPVASRHKSQLRGALVGFLCAREQTVEQTVDMPVIGDPMVRIVTSLWCRTCDKKLRLKNACPLDQFDERFCHRYSIYNEISFCSH